MLCFQTESDLKDVFLRYGVFNPGAVDLFRNIARRKNLTPAQIELTWLLVQKPWIVSMPRTTELERLDENMEARAVQSTSEDL